MQIPDDENGQVLRRLLASGEDLSKPREISFHFVFPTRAQAIGFLEQITDRDIRVELAWDAERAMWECTAVRYMMPLHVDTTALELLLTELAAPLEGSRDGWGCLAIKL